LQAFWPLQALPPVQAMVASVPVWRPLAMFEQLVMKSAAAEARHRHAQHFLAFHVRSPAGVNDAVRCNNR
jgi:hypothetical protein